MKNSASGARVRRIVTMALFCAIAYVAVFTMRISGIGGFLTFDIKDTVIAIAAMLFGPIVGVIIALAVSLLELVTISGTGFWGFLMNFVSSAVFAGVASTVYTYFPRVRHRMSGAVAGLCGSVVATTAVMLVMNLLITPLYYHVPVETVRGMLLPLLLPFNAIKSTLNAALVMMLYKPVATALRRTRLITAVPLSHDGEQRRGYRLDGRTAAVLVGGLVVAVGCVVLLVVVLGGEISLIK